MFVYIYLTAIIAVTAFLVVYSLRSSARHRKKLSERNPYPIAKWLELFPKVDEPELLSVLDAISGGVGVDACFLRPSDRFDRELALSGMLEIDDDTIEEVAESVVDKLNVSWNPQWHSVHQAVEGIIISRRAMQKGCQIKRTGD